MAQEQPQTMILTEDEASLYLQATTTAVWAPRRQTPTVPVHPGREKVCFYGALNLKSGQQTLWRAQTMNSETTAHYLQHLLETYPQVPILLLWDPAKWHYGQPVRDLLAANPRLEVMYLPPASPDLNPQEQVWKATRKAVSHNHRTQRLADLADQFEAHLASTTFPSSFLDMYGFNNICPMFI